MKKIVYQFSFGKNQQLIQERQISFEIIMAAIEEGQLLDILEHPNVAKYPQQKMYVVEVNDYVYLVPFVQINPHTVFLKTIFPSRKAKKRYVQREVTDEK